MRVAAFWWGGPSYAPTEKPEFFSSIADAGEVLEGRYENVGNPATPGVTLESEMLLHHCLDGEDYDKEPFARLYLSKNGRWKKENL